MTGAEHGAADQPSVVPQYEALRSAALGAVLPPEARSGLTLLLRRGLWGWARAMAITNVAAQPTCPPASHWTPPEHGRALIHLFAAMAIHADHWGGPS